MELEMHTKVMGSGGDEITPVSPATTESKARHQSLKSTVRRGEPWVLFFDGVGYVLELVVGGGGDQA